VHRFPSSHDVPSGNEVPEHAPALQASLVQGLPSEQEFESSGTNRQPTAGTHESSVHALASLQVTGDPPQTPDEQRSGWVHALRSLHAVPFATAVQDWVLTPG